MTAIEWKRYYAAERHRLGEGALAALLDGAPPVGRWTALVFPHTRLEASGLLVAAAARAIVESGRDEVLALGVLHRSRAGAVARSRGVHGHGLAGDAGLWRDEFSLDALRALVELQARRCGRRAPLLIERYPLLTGDDPATLSGYAELRALVDRGAAVVATADLVHHGIG
ncbi:MAG: hypothetical protein KGL18_04795 [Burkholderiales bacterium]|nr:hypothetical protein [Burkholderiales bacterium]MDE2502282.1 hypothetical protein [Burkholderiales bacterium]